MRIYFLQKVTSAVDLTCKFSSCLFFPINKCCILSCSALGVQVNTLIWTVIEVDIGIVCACFPTLKPLWSRERPEASFKGSSTSWRSRITSKAASRATSNSLPMWSRDKSYNSVGSTSEVTEPPKPTTVVPDRIHTNETVGRYFVD